MKKLITFLAALIFLMAVIIFVSLAFPDLIAERYEIGYPPLSSQEQDDGAGLNLLLNWPVNTADGSRAVKELASSITAGIDDDYERMVAIYSWVTENIAYDLDKASNISAYGSGAEYLIDTRQGVCHDYAQLTEELLIASGIEATYEKGEVINSSGETELHAWNHAFVDDIWYALDTTWGAGIILEDRTIFVQKPRYIYLTTPEELSRLHNDPDYKQTREQEYMQERSALEPVIILPEYEEASLTAFNDYRLARELPLLSEEIRLNELIHNHAVFLAEEICAGEEISLQELNNQLSGQAGDLLINSAAMHAMVKWLNHPDTSEHIFEKIVAEQSVHLDEKKWQALASGAVSKGDLLVYIFVLIEYQ